MYFLSNVALLWDFFSVRLFQGAYNKIPFLSYTGWVLLLLIMCMQNGHAFIFYFVHFLNISYTLTSYASLSIKTTQHTEKWFMLYLWQFCPSSPSCPLFPPEIDLIYAHQHVLFELFSQYIWTCHILYTWTCITINHMTFDLNIWS